MAFARARPNAPFSAANTIGENPGNLVIPNEASRICFFLREAEARGTERNLLSVGKTSIFPAASALACCVGARD
jgi:hypothetical protein